MKKLPINYPLIPLKEKEAEIGKAIYTSFVNIAEAIKAFRRTVVEVVNFNSISFVSQDAEPTVAAGKAILWEDSDATSGQPSHYIVFTDTTGTQVRFPSEQTIP
jgi:hypothetical protein